MELCCDFDYYFKHCAVDNRFTRVYQCRVKAAQITKPRTVIKSIKGNHLKENTDDDVEAISFESSTMDFFPRGIAKFFPNLTVVKVNSCGLKEISAEDLNGLENISLLSLNCNELTSLPVNLLANMKSLENIYIYSNKLTHMSPKMFDVSFVSQIKQVDLTNNTNIDSVFWHDSKKNLTTLKKGVDTIQKLMQIIQQNCLPPIEDYAALFRFSTIEKLHELWTSSRLSDFTIECGSKQFKVHKFVIGMQSPVLATMLENEMEERKTNQMKISDFSAETVEEFLEYLYSGIVKTESNAMDLFVIAAKYDVPSLRAAAEEIISNNLNESNAIEIMGLGQLHGSTAIARDAYDYIRINILEELDLPDDLDVSIEDLRALITAKEKRDEKVKDSRKAQMEMDILAQRIIFD